jgi:predicted P-loop ATPase
VRSFSKGSRASKKSTALRALGEPWFTDQIADLGGKEASIQTRGVWIIEIAELDSMRRVEVGRVKAFMSCAADRYRPPYGKRPVDYPRQCVFAGSVNHGTYLHDETGNRRFWPVECHDIDIDGLHAAKEQLWAEAVVRFRDREPWWLDTPQLIAEAEEEQAARFDADPWEERVRQYVASRDDVSITQILDSCIIKPTKDWTQLDKNRASRVLQSLGWGRYRGHDADGVREWRYHRLGSVRQDRIW